MQIPIQHLKFLLTSTNQHGVHSPFVYKFITQGLYATPRQSRKKIHDVLFKGIAYFNARKIQLPEGENGLKTLLSHKFPKVTFEKGPYDIVYITHPERVVLSEYRDIRKKIHNDTMLLVNAIHRDKKAEMQWEEIKKSDHVTVTLDFFWCGAVFFRREQAKEHFKIRL